MNTGLNHRHPELGTSTQVPEAAQRAAERDVPKHLSLIRPGFEK